MSHIKEVNDFALSTPDQMAQDAIWKADREIQMHDKIVASISGGSDSDIMLDLLHRLIGWNWFTGTTTA